jgi:predicted methyltransferase
MSARTIAASLLAVAIAACAVKPAPAVPPERRPATVMSWRGADWLERAGREEEQRPAEIIRTMGLKDGDLVADLGCATGYFARRMARAVAPRGRVYAVDIQPEMLDLLKRRAAEEGVANIVPVLGETDDPKLLPGTIDWVLLVDVYHELQQPKATLAHVRKALAPGGRVAVIEYRLEGTSALHIREEHRMSPQQVLAEWEPAGFRLVARHEFLPTQHFFVFGKTPGR